jgi:phospholipid/cholesterol/gamma-HCH transport system substrate-binding protein
LAPRGEAAVQDLVAKAPESLAPAGQVLQALQGTEPQDDLSDLVAGLESIGRALSEEQGELEAVLAAGAGAADTFAGQRDALAEMLSDAPETLAVTRGALSRLDTTMAELRSTAPVLRPSVSEAARLLAVARPVLRQARPVVADLRLLARDLRPLLGDAVPVVRQATEVTDDVAGPVVDRLRGPVLKTVLSPYRGETPFYEELGYMIAGLGATAKMTDANGASIAFQPGLGQQSAGGLPPLPLDSVFADLLGLEGTNP